jgi:hypothetical protein
MSEFEVSRMQDNNIAFLYATRDDIDMSPSYQRQGAIWSTYKQQLLIDSLINGFDIPKIYLHQFPNPRTLEDGRKVRYALIDGKQRLEAIFGFMDGDFPLDSGFELLSDSQILAKGRTYTQLLKEQPRLISRFNARSLDVVTIRTDDIELIEEMFSRLNEAVPLNAAEKRNAFGGPCPTAVRNISGSPFFEEKLPFGNSRYRHYDLAAKFLYWEDQARITEPDEKTILHDVKKYRLDTFFREMKITEDADALIQADKEAVQRRLAVLASTFVNDDYLLGSIGMVSLYFLLAQKRESEGRDFPARTTLVEFEEGRKLQRVADEDQLGRGEYQILEFNRLAQSPNDGSALTFRLRVLDAYCSALEEGSDPIDAVVKATRTVDE